MPARLLTAILLFIGLHTTCIAYSDATLVFLTRPPSGEAFARGNTYSLYSSEDPLLGDLNPAILGIQAARGDIRASFFQNDVELNNSTFVYQDPFRYSRRSLSIGFSEAELRGFFEWILPLSFGVSLHEVDFDYGMLERTDAMGNVIDEINAAENAKGISLGAALHYDIFDIAIGVSNRFIHSDLGLVGSAESPDRAKTDEISFDIGAAVLMKMHRLNVEPGEPNKQWARGLEPLLIFEADYALTNIGGEVSYVDRLQGDPMPRTGRLGLGLIAGLQAVQENGPEWNLLRFSGSIAASDELVDRNSMGEYSYLHPLGKVHLGKNLILSEASDEVAQMQGIEFGMAELFYYRTGSVNDPHYLGDYRTSGYSIHLRGMLQLLTWGSSYDSKSLISWLAQHVDLAYVTAEWKPDNDNGLQLTSFEQLVLSLRR